MMPITGFFMKSSSAYPICRARERWPNERRSVAPNHRWLLSSSSVLRLLIAITLPYRERLFERSCRDGLVGKLVRQGRRTDCLELVASLRTQDGTDRSMARF